MRSFDVAPITLSDKVLVHIVLPRCEVVSIQLLARESAPHLSIHDCVDVSLKDELCSEATIEMRWFLVVGVEYYACGWARSRYQTAVVEKTVPRRNPWEMCVNRPLHVGTSFVALYIY